MFIKISQILGRMKLGLFKLEDLNIIYKFLEILTVIDKYTIVMYFYKHTFNSL